MNKKEKEEFRDKVSRGKIGHVTVRSNDDLKDALMIAAKEKMLEHPTQYDASIRYGISQPAVSNIMRGKKGMFRNDYLFALLFKAGVKINITLM